VKESPIPAGQPSDGERGQGPLLSVIIVNYNGERFLRRCLGSLRAQTCRDLEIIVADNASRDASVRIVREEYPEVRLLALPENLHFCRGNNAALALAQGKFIAFLNNDTHVVPEWAAEIIRGFEDHPEAGAIACKLVLADQPEVLDNAGTEWLSVLIGHKIGWLQPARDFAEPRLIFGFCGGGCALRREVLEQVGAFDEDFESHYEDVDLSFRVQLAGWRCLYQPTATVFHHTAASYGQTSPLVVHRTTRNGDWVVVKNVPWPWLLKYGWAMVIHRLYALVYWAFHGGFWARVKGHWAALRGLRRMLGKRRVIQQQAKATWRELEQYVTLKCLPDALLGTKWPRLLHALGWPARCWRRLLRRDP